MQHLWAAFRWQHFAERSSRWLLGSHRLLGLAGLSALPGRCLLEPSDVIFPTGLSAVGPSHPSAVAPFSLGSVWLSRCPRVHCLRGFMLWVCVAARQACLVVPTLVWIRGLPPVRPSHPLPWPPPTGEGAGLWYGWLMRPGRLVFIPWPPSTEDWQSAAC